MVTKNFKVFNKYKKTDVQLFLFVPMERKIFIQISLVYAKQLQLNNKHANFSIYMQATYLYLLMRNYAYAYECKLFFFKSTNFIILSIYCFKVNKSKYYNLVIIFGR